MAAQRWRSVSLAFEYTPLRQNPLLFVSTLTWYDTEHVQAGDAVLEALAERNLADAREADDDLPGSLRHLRRCWNLAQTGRNTALEVDTCRRLCTVYSEIAAASPGLEGAIKSKGSDGREEGSGGKGGEDDTDTTGLTEPEVRIKHTYQALDKRVPGMLAFVILAAIARAAIKYNKHKREREKITDRTWWRVEAYYTL